MQISNFIIILDITQVLLHSALFQSKVQNLQTSYDYNNKINIDVLSLISNIHDY